MLNLSAEEIRSLVTATAAARDKRAVKALKKLALDDPMSFLITAWALDEGICGPLPAVDPLRKFLGRVLRS
jgi:hypothetical protein